MFNALLLQGGGKRKRSGLDVLAKAADDNARSGLDVLAKAADDNARMLEETKRLKEKRRKAAVALQKTKRLKEEKRRKAMVVALQKTRRLEHQAENRKKISKQRVRNVWVGLSHALSCDHISTRRGIARRGIGGCPPDCAKMKRLWGHVTVCVNDECDFVRSLYQPDRKPGTKEQTKKPILGYSKTWWPDVRRVCQRIKKIGDLIIHQAEQRAEQRQQVEQRAEQRQQAEQRAEQRQQGGAEQRQQGEQRAEQRQQGQRAAEVPPREVTDLTEEGPPPEVTDLTEEAPPPENLTKKKRIQEQLRAERQRRDLIYMAADDETSIMRYSVPDGVP